jgi:hypothetical protein
VPTYREYLESKHWRDLSRRIESNRICSSSAVNVISPFIWLVNNADDRPAKSTAGVAGVPIAEIGCIVKNSKNWLNLNQHFLHNSLYNFGIWSKKDPIGRKFPDNALSSLGVLGKL